MWEVLVSGITTGFLRCASNMAWATKGEILSILKFIDAVRIYGLHFTLSMGRVPFHSRTVLQFTSRNAAVSVE